MPLWRRQPAPPAARTAAARAAFDRGAAKIASLAVLPFANLSADPDNEFLSDRIARAGRRTEIDWMNGAIVRVADRCGIEAPLNRQVVEMIRFLERRAAGRRPPP